MSASATCRHCGLPFSGLSAGSRLPESAFCCFGCSVAYDITQASEGRASGSLSPVHVRLALAVVFSMAVMMFSLISYSDFIGGGQPADSAAQAFSQLFSYLAFLCAVPVLLLLGGPMIRRLGDSRLGHSVWLEILALTGVVAAFLLSAINLIRGTGHTYFETVVFTLLLWTTGRYVEAQVRTRTMISIRDAVTGSRRKIGRVTARDGNGDTEPVQIEALALGDVIRLHAGDAVPVDGEIVRGQAYIDESITTGESLPVTRKAGDTITAGATVVDAMIDLRLTADPAAGSLARLEQDVSQAVTERGQLSQAADRASRVLVFITIALGTGTLAYWWQQIGVEDGLLNTLSVFLVACPCSLGIAVPLVVYFGLQTARREGALFRSGEGLERAGKIDKIFFDRTGTLTAGLPRFEKETWSKDHDVDRDLLQRTIVSIERQSRHPFARAVAAAPEFEGVQPIALEDCRTIPGAGMIATAPDLKSTVRIGSAALMESDGVTIPEGLSERADQIRKDGGHTSFVGVGNRVAVLLEFRQDSSRETVDALNQLGHLNPEIITGGSDGDGTTAFKWPVHTGVSPQGKVDMIDTARHTGRRVAMVGDGLNDAVALAAADLGVAVHNAQDVNQIVSDVRLLHPGLEALPILFRVARRARLRMWQNIAWSIGYNSVGLVLAVTGHLHPLAAAVAMFGSSMIVLWNSRRWNVH